MFKIQAKYPATNTRQLIDYIKISENVDIFKTRLENFKRENFLKPGNYWKLSQEIFSRINDMHRGKYVEFLFKIHTSPEEDVEASHISTL